MTADPNEHFWRRRALMTTVRAGAGHWLAIFLPLSLGCSVIFATALLILRREDGGGGAAWLYYATGLGLSAIGAWWYARKKFFSVTDALVRLDSQLRLHNRLTSAMNGIGPWPQPARKVDDGFEWRWSRIFPMPAAAILTVAAAAWIPLPAATGATTSRPTQLPVALTQVESWINTLQKEDVTQPQATEELKQRMEDLLKQKPDQWFTHSSLEAADTLRQETEGAIKELGNNLENANSALDGLEALDNQRSDSQIQNLESQLQNALSGMELGKLPLNSELLNQLKALDLKNLKQLTPAQLQQLKQALEMKLGACKECTAPGDKAAIMEFASSVAPGNGGPGGGGPPAPLTSKGSATNLNTTRTESAASNDLSRAALGDVVSVGSGKHEVDKDSYKGPTAGGAAAAPGAGGETVWKDSFTPDESEILQRFFK